METNAANVVDICNARHRIPVRSPEYSTKYFVLLIARVQILFTFFLKRLNGHKSVLTKKPFLPVSQHFGLSDHSIEDFNRMKILVIEQNCLYSDFQRHNRERFALKNSVFYIRTVLTGFMYIFFHSVYSQRIFYYCHKVQDLCSPPLINDNL
jgi:hypothetical protein